jgi:hypothetical protein
MFKHNYPQLFLLSAKKGGLKCMILFSALIPVISCLFSLMFLGETITKILTSAQEFMSLVARENQRWFWTGGRISGQTVTWPNGVTQNAGDLRSMFSHTGG